MTSHDPTPTTSRESPDSTAPGRNSDSEALATAKKILVPVLTRPVTTGLVLVLLAVGVVTSSAWTRVSERAWFDSFALSAGAFDRGAWWTPFTGAVLTPAPWHLALITAASILIVGILESRLRSRSTLGILVLGQTVGTSAVIIASTVFAGTGWAWAQSLGDQRVTTPTFALVAAAVSLIALWPSPWRFRGALVLGVTLSVAFLLVGTAGDLGRIVTATVFGVMAVRPGRRQVTLIQWRNIAAVLCVGTAAVSVVSAVSHPVGIFGGQSPDGTRGWYLAGSVIAALALAVPLNSGRRLGWVLVVTIGALHLLAIALVVLTASPNGNPEAGIGVELSSAVLWVVLLLVLVAGRRAFRVRVRRRHRTLSTVGEEARRTAVELMKEHGGGTLSWMITWPRTDYLFTENGVVGGQRHGNVQIGLGDPIAAEVELPSVMQAVDDKAAELGVIPCFFSASERTRAAAPAGWRSLVVADDTIIDLPTLELTGKKWQPARGALNRAQREGISFRLVHLHEQPWAVLAQVRAISEGWVGDKALPEMGFTLGGVDQALDPHVMTALAMDDDGSVHGLLSWLPVYGAGGSVTGWTLDLMRRRDDGFGPVIEFLITSSALAFKDQGALFASLSGAPLSGTNTDPGPVEHVVDRLARTLEPIYGFQSLHTFKKKFNPRYEPLFLLYRDEADLPAIAAALTRAFLPDATPLDFVRAGLSLRHS